jgi:hypothetical protein
MTISGTGSMDNYVNPNSTGDKAPWYDEYGTDITDVIIESGVTSIGNYAFNGCTNLTSVVIPYGVTSIGNYAFYGCTNLTSVEIPGSVDTIGNWTFTGCASLKDLMIHDGVESIGMAAFQNCTNLTYIVIPDGVKTIGAQAFYGCNKLTYIEIPGSVDTIGMAAFQGCTALTSAIIPNKVTTIGAQTFQGCTALTSVIIPNKVTIIGNNAFNGCSSLTSVDMPGATSIGDATFQGCTALTSVIIPNKVTIIGNNAFNGCSNLAYIVIPDGVKTIGSYAFYNCNRLTSVIVTGGLAEGKTVEGGIIDKYFKNAESSQWRFPNSGLVASYLYLPDINSSEYCPDNIKGLGGKELHFKDAVFKWDGLSWTEVTSLYAVSGTVKDSSNPTAGIAGATVSLGTTGMYTAVTGSDGKYTIANVPGNTSGDIKASKTGYDTSTLSNVTVSSENVTGKDISLSASEYTVSGTITGGDPADVAVSYTDNASFTGNTVTDGDGKYTISGIPYGTSLDITIADGAVPGYHQTGTVSVTVNVSFSGLNLYLKINKYSVSGTVTAGGTAVPNVEVSLVSDITYGPVTTDDNGSYTIPNVPHGTSGSITVDTVTGYHQEEGTAYVTVNAEIPGKSIDLKINEYTVTLTKGIGVSGFEYSINDGEAVGYIEPFKAEHGDKIVIIASFVGGYEFKAWSGSDSEENLLEISSVSGDTALTAHASLVPVPLSPSDTYYSIAFSSGSYYTVYVDGVPASSPLTVTEGASAFFRVQTPEGYRAVLSIEGIASLSEHKDGSYRISEIYSNVRVTVTVTADGGDGNGLDSGPGSDSGEDSGNGNDSGNNQGTGSGNNGVSYWIPILIAGVFIACIAAVLIGHTFVRHRKG